MMNLKTVPGLYMAVAALSVLLCAMLHASAALCAFPTVTVMPLDTSEAGRLAYAGPAVQQMLISRLASEKLDVIPAGQVSGTDQENSLDYTITGKIIAESNDKIKVVLVLHAQGNDSPVASYEVKPSSLGTLVDETGRYAIILAQKISDLQTRKTVLSAFNDTSTSMEESDQPLIDDEQLKLARIHPDKFYRETPIGQKGTASPIDMVPESEEDTGEKSAEAQEPEAAQQDESGTEKFLRSTLPPPESDASNASDEEEDYWEPDYPPVYDDELSRKMKEEEKQQRAGSTGNEEDMTLEYPPEYDENSPVATSSAPSAPSGTKSGASSNATEEKSWWSYLWPFGGHEEKQKMPKPIKPDRLPYPVPPGIKEGTETAEAPAAEKPFSMASIPPTGMYDTGAGSMPSAQEPPEAPGVSAGAAQPEESGATSEQDKELMHLYNSMADSVEGESAEKTDSSTDTEEEIKESDTGNVISDVSSSFFNATENAGSTASQDSAEAEISGSEPENAEEYPETEEAPVTESAEQPEEQPAEQTAKQTAEQVEGEVEGEVEEQTTAQSEEQPEEQSTVPTEETEEPESADTVAEEPPASEGQTNEVQQAETEEQTPETAPEQQPEIKQAGTVQHVTPHVASSKSKIGWFSWLWPDSWKGGGSEAARHTATVKPAVNEEEMQKEPPYHAASEPPPAKTGRKGPIWVWN